MGRRTREQKDKINARNRQRWMDDPEWAESRRQDAREWAKRNRPSRLVTERKHRLKRKFGWGPEEYARLLAEQGGTCRICKTTPSNRHLAVDHDHTTGRIRGLLCSRCNVALGQADDDPARLRSMAEYLEAFNAGVLLPLSEV